MSALASTPVVRAEWNNVWHQGGGTEEKCNLRWATGAEQRANQLAAIMAHVNEENEIDAEVWAIAEAPPHHEW